MVSVNLISIIVAYATPEKQVEIALVVSESCTVEAAIQQSNIISQFPEVDLSKNPVGIFGKRVTHNTIIQDGDRVEIYRALITDPKTARRLKARKL